MKKQSSIYLRLPLLVAVFGFMAACTTQSGPTYTANAIVVPGQQVPTYRVACGGLFASSKSCFKAAIEICGDKPVTPLEAVDGIGSSDNRNDPREITFMCGKPVQVQAGAQPQLQPQPQPQAQPQPQPRQVLLQGDANFASDSAILTGAARTGLDDFVKENAGASFRRITVTGYTDSMGSRAHNQKLSEARAQAVLQYLRSHGMQADEFAAEGGGADNPVASNATEEGRALNRRVEIRIVAQ
jgi:outer membrane protein OmpA-like peptidoglycan-associated protein